ncbi:MAG: hypothetical protein OSJ27_00885 [Candidatus Gastranaerophilales bacterium]|nr:hypothetical protein [Candidatus Gastranaerophilales bacterium]
MFNFAGTTHKQIIGISVTPNIGVEVIQTDRKSNQVIKYGRRFIEYNFSTREIQDYGAFKSAVIDLFNELDINAKSNVFLTLPNVHFDFMNLPLILPDDGINTAISSKAEESYIFKRVEPISAWLDVNVNTNTETRHIIYSSFQKTAIDEIKDVFADIGSNLVGIESAYSAILRGIYFSNLCSQEIAENQSWNVLLINTNSYAIFSLVGTRLVDYQEVPLAIKSFSYEEAYQAITTSVSQILPNYPARKLLIVSQADDICAEVLKTQIIFDEKIETIDCNKYAKKPFVDVASEITSKEASSITLSAIGAANSQMSDFLVLNILGKGAAAQQTLYATFMFMDKEILVTPDLIRGASYILSGIIILIIVALVGISMMVSNISAKELQQIKNKTTSIESEIKTLTSQDGFADINSIINNIILANKQAISFYDSLSSDIPSNVWLTYYYNQDGSKVAVEGISTTINDIYGYYKSLKVLSPQSSIKLNRLKVVTGPLDDIDANINDNQKIFDFEIANVQSPKSQRAAQDPNTQQANQSGNANSRQSGTAVVPPVLPKLEPVDMN